MLALRNLADGQLEIVQGREVFLESAHFDKCLLYNAQKCENFRVLTPRYSWNWETEIE